MLGLNKIGTTAAKFLQTVNQKLIGKPNVRFAVLTENEPSKFGDVDYVLKFINKNEDPNG